MLYRLIDENNANLLEPIKTVFKNRNIHVNDIDWYIRPVYFEHSPKLLNNIEEGADLLLLHIEKGNHIHLQIDKDLDGFTSAAVLYNYLKNTFPKIKLTWSNHLPEKKHGIDVDIVPVTTDLLIVPDAGTAEYEIHKQLKQRNVDVLVIDHHEATSYSKYATVINNQLDEYPNKWLSGAGVVYKFIQLLDEKLNISNSQRYIDLVAFGLIGDAMNLASKETKWLVTKGLNNLKNEFLKEIIKENVDEGTKLTPTIISYKCIPKINAYLRVCSKEELDELFKAFIEHQEITHNPRLRKENKYETWARRITRICNNMYSKQSKLKNKLMEELDSKIVSEKLDKNTFIIIEIEGDMIMNMSGYVASFVASKYRKPTLILRKNNQDQTILNGSMRGYDKQLKNTKSFLNSLELFDFVEGHPNAAGVQINTDNFKSLNARVNKAFQNLTLNEAHLVDLVMPAKILTKKFITDMERYSHVWGKGIEAPILAIEKVEVNLSEASIMGKNADMLKFDSNEISFVKFNEAEKLIELKNLNKAVVLNVIGRTGINTWNGVNTAQFIIEAFEIVEIKEENKKFLF
ncbi:DHH family phosphoesterase [Solibacillus sp. FSL H8-0523]|uniref:DHH family phosphoesterase n=1 Tax=Solibacillus sp. FSL H8-0523 TaxID=2954511 RepID=UPI0031016B30